jgi:hypothetical protein
VTVLKQALLVKSAIRKVRIPNDQVGFEILHRKQYSVLRKLENPKVDVRSVSCNSCQKLWQVQHGAYIRKNECEATRGSRRIESLTRLERYRNQSECLSHRRGELLCERRRLHPTIRSDEERVAA